jgi:hypothetical protein
MRKFFTFMIATAAISLASCGGKSNGTTAELDSLATETVAEEDATPAEQAQAVIALLQEQIKNADPEQIKAIGQQVADKVAEFIAKGDEEAAKTYSETINRFISDNAETLKSIGASTTIAEALSKVEDLPAGILEAATGAATGVQTSADAQVDAAKAAIEAAPAAAKQAAQDAAAAAQKQAEDAAAAAQQKAQDKANQAIDDAAAAAKKKLGL